MFNPIIEYLKTEIKHGYILDGNNIISTPFADDFNIITTNKKTHQRIINNISKYAATMNLKLEPRKCRSLSICAGQSKEISFTIGDLSIPCLNKEPEKFLGAQLTFSGKPSETYEYISKGIESSLTNIDNTMIRDEYKCDFYYPQSAIN